MEFKIHNKMVGEGHPLFFIAEAGVNHNGSIDLGKKLIDFAVDSGADAVKFQSFKTENIIIPKAPKSTYHVETTGKDSEQTWFELLKTQELTKEMHERLIEYCNKKEIIFLSTPYDEESVDLLISLDVPAIKIASTDTNNIPFIRYIAAKGKPIILSTAMATMDEVEEAVNTIRQEGLEELALLQCTGNYPSQITDSNLRVMKTYAEKLNCIIGYSDHTTDLINPVAATAMGAKIYEKHFTLDKSLPGPDHRMSLEPEELKQTIRIIRDTELSLGSPEKRVLEDEKENQKKLRKSIISIKKINKGDIVTTKNIAIMRPQTGLEPRLYSSLLGKKVKRDINKYVPIQNEDIEWS